MVDKEFLDKAVFTLADLIERKIELTMEVNKLTEGIESMRLAIRVYKSTGNDEYLKELVKKYEDVGLSLKPL